MTWHLDHGRSMTVAESRAPVEDLPSIKEWFSNIEIEQLQLELNALLIVKSDLYPDAKWVTVLNCCVLKLSTYVFIKYSTVLPFLDCQLMN